MDYGHLYAITPPTQISLDPEYALRFAWPRPPEVGPSSQSSDEKRLHVSGSFWLGATSDYDPDKVELKTIRDSLDESVLLCGVMCIEQPPTYQNPSSEAASGDEDISEPYLVLWGLRQQSVPSANHLQISHGEVYPQSAWCYVVAWEDVLDPSLAPLADQLLQLDLLGILSRIQANFQLSTNDFSLFKETWKVTRSNAGAAAAVTAQIACLDFFGQETLQVRVESSHADQ